MQKMLAGTAFAVILGGAAFAQATDTATDPAASGQMHDMFTISVDGTETEVTPEVAAEVCPDSDYSAAVQDEVLCEITQAEADEAGIVVAEDWEDDDTLSVDDFDTDDEIAVDEVEDEEETQ